MTPGTRCTSCEATRSQSCTAGQGQRRHSGHPCQRESGTALTAAEKRESVTEMAETRRRGALEMTAAETAKRQGQALCPRRMQAPLRRAPRSKQRSSTRGGSRASREPCVSNDSEFCCSTSGGRLPTRRMRGCSEIIIHATASTLFKDASFVCAPASSAARVSLALMTLMRRGHHTPSFTRRPSASAYTQRGLLERPTPCARSEGNHSNWGGVGRKGPSVPPHLVVTTLHLSPSWTPRSGLNTPASYAWMRW